MKTIDKLKPFFRDDGYLMETRILNEINDAKKFIVLISSPLMNYIRYMDGS